MIWADRVGVVWAGIVCSVFLFITGGAGFDNWMMIGGWKIIPYFILPVWLLLRAVDWISGGPQRRRFNA